MPKGYDQTLLHDLGLARDIELGFVGSTGSVAYSGRKALLDELGGVENLLVTKTKSGEEYLRTLNRIRFFVSADVGMGEYMIKNFEAMACGCVLLARPGERENEALGFRDMENIVLYRSVADIQEKLAILRLDTALAERIARSGQALAIERFSFAAVGQSIVEAMRPALREPERPGWLEDLATYFYLRVAAEKSWGFRRVCYCSACFSGLGRCRTDEDRRIAHACLAL